MLLKSSNDESHDPTMWPSKLILSVVSVEFRIDIDASVDEHLDYFKIVGFCRVHERR